MVQTSQVIKEIDKFKEGTETIEAFSQRMTGNHFVQELKAKVEGKKERTKEERMLCRRTSERVVECFKSLKKGDEEKLDQIQTFAKRKIKAGYATELTNVVSLVVIGALFFPTLATPSLAVGMIGILALVKLEIYLYETDGIYTNLEALKLKKTPALG